MPSRHGAAVEAKYSGRAVKIGRISPSSMHALCDLSGFYAVMELCGTDHKLQAGSAQTALVSGINSLMCLVLWD